MKKSSIKIKLVLLIFLMLIPLIMLQYIRIKNEFNHSVEMELKASREFAEAISLSFVNYLEEIWTAQYAMGLAIVSSPNWESADIEGYLDKMLSKEDGILGYSWVSPEGTIIASTSPPVTGMYVGKRAYFQEILKGREKVVSNLTRSYTSKMVMLPVARGIWIDDEFKGILVTVVDIKQLPAIFPVDRAGETSKYGLIDKGGMLVYRNGNPDIPFEKRLIKRDSPAWRALKGEVVKTYARISSFDGSNRMGIDYPIKSIGWACFVTTSVDGLLKKYRDNMKKDILILFLVSMGSFCFAMILANRLIDSINKLKKAAEAVTDGDLTVRTKLEGNDELAATGQAFDRMTEGINQMLTEAEEYARFKAQFFATVSHELRTPLNIILGAVQLIEKLDINDRKHYDMSLPRYIQILKQNSYRLLRLINNLIDINKIEGKHFTIKLKNYDIVRVVEDITLSVVEYTKLKNIELIFDTEIEEKIMAIDPDKIERIILNLLSNAIKFTDSGGIIQVGVFDKGDKIAISVKDTGIGIPEMMLKKIFDCFIQVDASLRRKTEGSGIGLSLVKSLTELHGGTVSVQSKYQKGSEFTVELPVRLLEEEGIVHEEAPMSNVERINIEFSDIYL